MEDIPVKAKLDSIKSYLDKADLREINALFEQLQVTGKLFGEWEWEVDESFIQIMEVEVDDYKKGKRAGYSEWNRVNEDALRIIKGQ